MNRFAVFRGGGPMIWYVKSPFTFEHLGFIPTFLSEGDVRSAREQLDSNYAHGGGWNPFEGFKLVRVPDNWWLEYPGDRPMQMIAYARLREEMIVVFEYAWVCIVQADGSYVVARMD